MSLTDMKLFKRDINSPLAVDEDTQRYPYGLSITLENESLQKLGIDRLPEVGAEMLVVGVGVVESANERKKKSGADRSFSIQLQEITVGPVKEGSALDAVEDAIEDA